MADETVTVKALQFHTYRGHEYQAGDTYEVNAEHVESVVALKLARLNVGGQMDTPKTITVEALQAHSYNGKDYAIGDTYEIDEQFVESVAIQGKAVRADRVEHAKQQAAAAAQRRAEAGDTSVQPIGTADFPVAAQPMTTAEFLGMKQG